jgi:hypothetical protein
MRVREKGAGIEQPGQNSQDGSAGEESRDRTFVTGVL